MPESVKESARRAKYTRRACQQCRRRKSRCDGSTPMCTSCLQLGDDCNYSQDPDGRRPAAKQYVAALEQRIAVLERELKAKTVIVENVDEEETIAFDLDRLKLDEETLEYVQYGPTSPFQHLASQFCPIIPEDSFNSASPDSQRVAWDRDLPYLPAWDEQLHEDVLSWFFAYFGYYQVVREKAFRRDMMRCLVSPSVTRSANYSPLLHNAILATACIQHEDPRCDAAAAEAFVQKSQQYLNEEGSRPMLSTCQGIQLIGSYYTSLSNQGLGYLYTGIAIRMTHTMGLVVDCATYVQRGLISEELRADRDRTMWACYLLDMLWSSYIGRSPTLFASGIKIALPAIDHELDQQPWSPLSGSVRPSPSYESTSFHWACKLAIIQERVMSSVYGTGKNIYSAACLSKVSELNLELETWMTELPTPIRIMPQALTPPPLHIIMLNCMFHFLVILLHRPYYCPHGMGQDESITAASVKRCIAAAHRVVALAQLCEKSPMLRHAPICLTQFLFIAGTTHLLTLVQTTGSGQKAEHAREGLDSCVDALRSMGLGHTTSALCTSLLLRLISEWTGDSAGSTSATVRGNQLLPELEPWQSTSFAANTLEAEGYVGDVQFNPSLGQIDFGPGWWAQQTHSTDFATSFPTFTQPEGGLLSDEAFARMMSGIGGGQQQMFFSSGDV